MLQPKPILYGLTFLLFLLIQSAYCSDNTTLPQCVIDHMATRQMRYHHLLWHQVRENWNRFSNETKKAFKDIGWKPPNPSKDSKGRIIKNNHAGEDFLYMHHDMVKRARHLIKVNNETYKITGWKRIPKPGDKTYPVPAPYQRGKNPHYLAGYKSDAYYYKKMRPSEKRLTNATILRNMTLNDLGNQIEAGLHNSMHMRWSDVCSVGYRKKWDVTNGVPDLDTKWDDPNYNWLVDTYSSHVNPVFWKLHGWIDDRIEDWRKAHNLTTIVWNGTWLGGPMSTGSKPGQMHSMGNSTAVGDVLEQGVEIFMNSGIEESTLESKIDPEFRPDESSDGENIRKHKGKKKDS